MNPAGKIPLLELDDGRALPESAAIIEYFEELHPEPPMIDADPVQRAKVRALERISADLLAITDMADAFLHPIREARGPEARGRGGDEAARG